MKKNNILNITINPETKASVLEKILLYINKPVSFFHIVSLNPENMVITTENETFKKVVQMAQIKIVDGVGVVVAGRLLGIKLEKLTGVDLMENLINLASSMRLRVLMIGGKEDLALKLSKCYSDRFPKAKFIGLKGIDDIQNPKKDEEDTIFSIVADYKPHLVFVAFGSPDQELWIARHKKEFSGSVVMGVGGAFDYLSGNVIRAPVILQKLGLEWLFRLINQPWRWKRQLKLFKYIWLVFKQKIEYIKNI